MVAPSEEAAAASQPRVLSLSDAVLLVVSSVIGVGIFLTPGRIAAVVPDEGTFYAAWVFGGVLSLSGALANAELGAMFPRAGGSYVFLREAYHPAAGFIAGWLSFFVVFSGSVATLAVGLAEAVASLMPVGDTARLAIALGAIAWAALVGVYGARAGARANAAAAVAKVLALAVLAFAGLSFGARHGEAAPASLGGSPLASMGLALSPVLFSYLGWNACVYVAGEVRDPERTVPRALFLGLGACLVIYLAVNVAYVRTLGIAGLAAERNAGEATARALFGSFGGRVEAVLIAVSIAGSLQANAIVGPRIAYAMALDGLFPARAARLHPRVQTPHGAIVAQALCASALVVVLRSLPDILDYTTFAIVLATLADTLALYVLRRRLPDAPRPYRAWGYPWLPALYALANVAVAVALAFARPWVCAGSVLVVLAGIPAYVAASAARRRVLSR